MKLKAERKKPDIHAPFGFNRIITPTNVDSRIIDLFGVKYIMSLSDLHDAKLTKVFIEGQTRIYKNSQAFPRVFLVSNIKSVASKNEAIDAMFDPSINLYKTAVVENWDNQNTKFSTGSAEIIDYQSNTVLITTQSKGNSFLILADTFYPTWHVLVDGVERQIYRTDYNFRGVMLPSGKNTVVFYDSLL